ncbi:MAG: putative ubiquitinyl hydrolase 1, partial [Streblomastix strix]
LKYIVSSNAQQFAGYAQQDSQEFVQALLDGLHEDLNRVKNKPYIEDVEEIYENLENDEIKKEDVSLTVQQHPRKNFSQIAWVNHLKRNQSDILSLFHGQLRSIIDCPECHRRSVKYDPFSVLQLPLPGSENVNFNIAVYGAFEETLFKNSLIKEDVKVIRESSQSQIQTKDQISLIKDNINIHPCAVKLTCSRQGVVNEAINVMEKDEDIQKMINDGQDQIKQYNIQKTTLQLKKPYRLFLCDTFCDVVIRFVRPNEDVAQIHNYPVGFIVFSETDNLQALDNNNTNIKTEGQQVNIIPSSHQSQHSPSPSPTQSSIYSRISEPVSLDVMLLPVNILAVSKKPPFSTSQSTSTSTSTVTVINTRSSPPPQPSSVQKEIPESQVTKHSIVRPFIISLQSSQQQHTQDESKQSNSNCISVNELHERVWKHMREYIIPSRYNEWKKQ